MTVTQPDGELVLGCKAKDPVTGCIGTVMAICRWLYGEDTVALAGLKENGFEKDKYQWFPVDRLELVVELVVEKEKAIE